MGAIHLIAMTSKVLAKREKDRIFVIDQQDTVSHLLVTMQVAGHRCLTRKSLKSFCLGTKVSKRGKGKPTSEPAAEEYAFPFGKSDGDKKEAARDVPPKDK